jgi:hypothetical protein
MSSTSENIHLEIVSIQKQLKCSFFEAVLEFCQINELEIEDIVKKMDQNMIEKLKQCAIDENMLQKKSREKRPKTLPI